MQYIKLQLGCLLVVLYIIITYTRTTYKNKIPCNKFFDLMMILSPWAVIFDGLTAWTVNNTDKVPDALNRAVHLLFFILMDLTIIVTALYMYDMLVGFSNTSRKLRLLVHLPGVISLGLICAGIGNLQFITDTEVNYSMGFSVYVCFVSLFVHYGAILALVISRHRFIPSDKILGTLSFIGIVGVILAVQIVFPQVLLTSICPTLLLLGMYIDFENPSIRRLTQYNGELSVGFATMVENRDTNTGGHIKRTGAYVDLILRKMRKDARYRKVITRDYMTNVHNSAPLHDIGKIATPDSILKKPGKLTDEEYAVIKEHAAKGGEIIKTVFQNLGDEEFHSIAYDVARHHHEKYNGKGYPDALSGEQIPLHARIMAIADVFDAVSQNRCYRDAMPAEECFKIIENGAGTDFDPNLARLFLDSKAEVLKLMNTHTD